MDISIGEVLAQFDSSFDENSDTSPIVNGGPVEPQRGFVLHRASNKQHWEGQLLMNNGISLTNSSDILEAKATGEDIGDYVIALGYSGWDAGQLEEEISDNAWLSINTSADEVLSLPVYERLNRCLKTLGINYQQLSDQTGHS
jgi:putative transcriptional regulator